MRSSLLYIKLFLLLSSFCVNTIAQNVKNYHGFESLGLSETATPIDVAKVLPSGSTWYAYIKNGKYAAWSGYHRFTGTITAIKVNEEKCIFYRIEDNNIENGWNSYVSPTSIYMAQYTKDTRLPHGYTFTGFEPVNAKSQSKKRNDGVAAMEFVRTCESYEGVFWQYGSQQYLGNTEHLKTGDLSLPNGYFSNDADVVYDKTYREGIYTGREFPMIDCQTLIKMAMAGIPYEYSIYADKTYQYRYLNAYPWSIHPSNIFLYELMEFCVSSGYEISPGPNFENLQAGDLIFFTSDGPTRDAHVRKVGHVAMFTGRWVADKGYKPEGVSGFDYPTIYSFPIFDKEGHFIGNDTTTLHPQTIEVFQASDKLPNKCVVRHGFLDTRTKTTNRRDRIVMYARLPLNTHGCWNNRNKWDNPANMIHVSGFDTDYRIDLVGVGKPLTLYIGSLNQSGNLSGVGENVATDYMPYSPDAYETIPEGAKLTKVEYYDELLRITKSRTSAKYIRKFFSNTTLEDMQKGYMYNGVNQYKVWNEQESPIIISGTLKKGEAAIIDTKTGRIYTSEGSVLTYHKGGTSNPGMKVVYCPTGQEAMVTWNN